MNAFYPIPEALVFVGLIVNYTPIGARLKAVLPGEFADDVEFRIADKATDVVQSLKGVATGIACLVALGVTGAVFSIGHLIFISVVFNALDLVTLFDAVGSLVELAWVLVLLWASVGFGLILYIYSLYSFFYWFQQMKRLPAYSRFWELYWERDEYPTAVTSVRRPPRLFIPGGVLMLIAVVIFWSLESGPDSLTVWAGVGLLWPIGFAIVGWSVYATFSKSPQSLAQEGRDITIAVLVQWWTRASISAIFGSLSYTMLLFPLAIGSMVYIEDAFRYARRQEGAAAYVDLLYNKMLFTLVVVMLVLDRGSLSRTLLSIYVCGVILLSTVYLIDDWYEPEDRVD